MNIPRTFILALILSCSAGAQENPAPAPAAAPAQSEMQKWIATTDEQWQAAYQRDVIDVHEAEVGKLKLRYLNLLEDAMGKASKARDLDGAVALRTEQKRFADTQFFPAQDEPGDPAAVKQARTALRALLAKLDKDTAARAKALLAKYDQVLAQAQTQLTQRQRLDDAVLVKTKRDEVAAAWTMSADVAAPQNPNLATQPRTPTPSTNPKLGTQPSAIGGIKAGKTFEMRMTGTTWSYPWAGKDESIRFEQNGILALDFLGFRRKWRTPSDGVIEAFAFANPSEKDTIQIDASERTGEFVRKGKKHTIRRLN